MNKINTIACFGTGTMGSAIAGQFAAAGFTTNIFLYHPDQKTQIHQRISAIVKLLVDHQLSAGSYDEVLSNLHYYDNSADTLKQADFVTESISEDLVLKQELWQKIEAVAENTTIFSTNTSGLNPDDIANKLQNPTRFVVAHFWNPAHLMPLVEVVPSSNTTEDTVTATVDLMSRINKHPVALKKASLGFVGNRIQAAVLREALNIVEQEIASPQAVDEIVKYSLGRRWNLVGPIASADLGGLDVFDNISKYLYADLDNQTGEDPRLKAKVDQHALGLKTGHGFYDWQGDTGQQLIKNRDQGLINELKQD